MKLQEVRQKIKDDNLDIYGVCEWLEKLGSEDDPIMYRGDEMTSRDLAAHLAQYTPALDVRISFYGTTKTSSCGLIRNSNFARMIKDRIDMYAAREQESVKATRKPRVEYRVTYNGWSETYDDRAKAKKIFVDARASGDKVSFQKVTVEFIADQDV